MHSLTEVYNTSRLHILIDKLVDRGAVRGLDTVGTKTLYISGKKVLRAISPRHNVWSVHVEESVATEFSLPLWKDFA